MGYTLVSAKLFPPQERDSLTKQTVYWRLVIRHSEVRCIYTGERLSDARLSLDHFLPWSFVAHDQLWNLIPTLPGINSSKSDHLPAGYYFDQFVRLQHQGLVTSHRHAGERKWEDYVEPFITDLRFSDRNDLLDADKLKPLPELAKTLGFAAGWRYRLKTP